MNAVSTVGVKVHQLAVRELPRSGKPEELVDKLRPLGAPHRGGRQGAPLSSAVLRGVGPLAASLGWAVLAAATLGARSRSPPASLLGAHDPAWAPGGSLLALTLRDQLWVLGADGRDARVLVRWPSGREAIERDPAWSPDGRSIAFAARIEPEGFDLYLVDARGGAPRRLTHRGRRRALAVVDAGRPAGLRRARRTTSGTSRPRPSRSIPPRRRARSPSSGSPRRPPTRPSRTCRRTAASWSSSRPARRRTARAILWLLELTGRRRARPGRSRAAVAHAAAARTRRRVVAGRGRRTARGSPTARRAERRRLDPRGRRRAAAGRRAPTPRARAAPARRFRSWSRSTPGRWRGRLTAARSSSPISPIATTATTGSRIAASRRRRRRSRR